MTKVVRLRHRCAGEVESAEMDWDFQTIRQTAELDLRAVKTPDGLEELRVKYLGRKGLLAEIYADLAHAAKEDKPRLGQAANFLRGWLQEQLNSRREALARAAQDSAPSGMDLTLPGVAPALGHRHLLTQIIDEICDLFGGLGFVVQDGPEVESEFYNFTALNIPVDHPSRDAPLIPFIWNSRIRKRPDRNLLLRSHTSPGQVRIMEQFFSAAGRGESGARVPPGCGGCQPFFYVPSDRGAFGRREGDLCRPQGVADCVLSAAVRGKDSYADASAFFSVYRAVGRGGHLLHHLRRQGAARCAGVTAGWRLWAAAWSIRRSSRRPGYEKNKYTGLAFGMGVERMAMLKYGIHDIRIFYENDSRFLNQF